MAWAAPRTWSTAEVPTASTWNQHVVTDMRYLGRSHAPGVRVRRDTDVSIANNTDTALTWTAEDWDVGGWWSSGTDLTCPEAGVYLVTVSIRWEAGDDDGFRQVYANNATASVNFINLEERSTQQDWPHEQTVSSLADLAASDVLRCRVRQTAGQTRDLLADPGVPAMTVVWVGPS